MNQRPNTDAKNRYEAVFCKLHEFARSLGVLQYYTFSNDAQDMFQQWNEEIMTESRTPNMAPVIQSHLQKMPKTIASLALIFELIGGGSDTVVGARATARALNWADYLKSHAFRLYSVGSFMAENAARILLDRRAQLPECFTARQVYRKDWAGLSDSDAAEAAIDVLIQHGYCQEQAVLPTITGGRPTVGYVWNPCLKGEG